MICEKCKPRELEAMRALESLTPSGSEFVNDPKQCVEHVRESQASTMRAMVKFARENRRMRETLRECLIATSVHIAALNSVTSRTLVQDDEVRSTMLDVIQGLEISQDKLESALGG